MLKKIFLLSVIPFVLLGGELKILNGSIKTHTEVFGDSTINPETTTIYSNLHIKDSIKSIQGLISIKSKDLISDNKDRDQHMYEAIEAEKYPEIKFLIKNIQKEKENYLLNGTLILHGTPKNIKVLANITQDQNKIIHLNSNFTIKSSEYGIQPITLMFLTVRDEIDIEVSLALKGE